MPTYSYYYIERLYYMYVAGYASVLVVKIHFYHLTTVSDGKVLGWLRACLAFALVQATNYNVCIRGSRT